MTDLPWLRLYTDTVDNEKIRLLAFEDRWHYIALLCLKQQGILDSKPALLERKVAIKLGLQISELSEVKRRLMEVELIDSKWNPKGWSNKQFKSDSDPSNAERQRRYRAKHKEKQTDKSKVTGDNDGSNVTVTPIDTDTEAYTDTDKTYTPDDLAIAETMFKMISELMPKARKPNFDKWANTIRLMREVDNIPHADIARVFTWANKDSFWQTNILSPTKFREKYSQLEIKARQSNEKGIGTNSRNERRSAIGDHLEKRIREVI